LALSFNLNPANQITCSSIIYHLVYS